jgi:hypothetical protein
MAGAYVPELQAVDSLLQDFMVGRPIPGGTIAITHDDKVIYERGIGYSNEARTIPMQETAMMRLASVSKPITASAIQQLAKDGPAKPRRQGLQHRRQRGDPEHHPVQRHARRYPPARHYSPAPAGA